VSGERYLTGAGGGVMLDINRYLSLRLDVGVPLRGRAGLPGAAAHFYIQSSPEVANWISRLRSRL
jgi:hemolysin activation/secretion protein